LEVCRQEVRRWQKSHDAFENFKQKKKYRARNQLAVRYLTAHAKITAYSLTRNRHQTSELVEKSFDEFGTMLHDLPIAPQSRRISPITIDRRHYQHGGAARPVCAYSSPQNNK
jgi:hypothetical protein